MTDDRAAEPGAALPLDVADVADDADDAVLEPGVGDELHGDDQPDAQQTEAEQPVRVSAPEQLPLIRQAAASDATPTGDQGAASEPDARSPEPDDAPDPDETAVLAMVGATLPTWLPATAPLPAGLATGPVAPTGQSAPSVPRHRRQPWSLLILSILLALTLGLATYLLLTTRAYEHRSSQWESAARTTGSDLTQARADLEATTSDLEATRDQLATAQARIVELADEKAQLGDDRAIQRQLVDYQQRISAAAGNVATALNSCIDGQYKLIGYLENPSAYDQADLARFRTDVQTVCGAATDANAALQRELKK